MPANLCAAELNGYFVFHMQSAPQVPICQRPKDRSQEIARKWGLTMQNIAAGMTSFSAQAHSCELATMYPP
jgi:hypothetical protein